jgi:hypothetical protein
MARSKYKNVEIVTRTGVLILSALLAIFYTSKRCSDEHRI